MNPGPPDDDAQTGSTARQKGCVRWITTARLLVGSCGPGAGRHPPGSAQHEADVTSIERMFEERIWPRELDDETGQHRLDKALELARAAPRRQRPMAWLTHMIKKEFPESEEAAA